MGTNEPERRTSGRDVEPSDDRRTYECLTCGWTTTTSDHPGTCPECEEGLRNRGTPLE